MKTLGKLSIIISTVLLISCIKPVDIVVPDSMNQVPAMAVTGTENSWKIDFGGFHAFNITDSDSRILLADASFMSYDIKSFEYFLNTAGNTQYRCYCEFPIKTLDDETFRCRFQNVYNQFDMGELNDRVISSPSGEIAIEPYYEYVGKKENSREALVGYMFLDQGNEVGLVDVSNVNNETVWINPSLEAHKQVMLAAAATSLVLKHRKWYQAFYEKSDEEIEYNY